ncbi:tyrosine-type recombinase/integrase [Amorphus sp. MBR-141]
MQTAGSRSVDMRVNLEGVASATAKLADGTKRTYYYAWRGGPRLPGKPGTPEFMAALHKARQERHAAPSGTLAEVIDYFQRSAAFTGLSQSSRRDYLRYMREIREEFGTMPIAALSQRRARSVFKGWRDGLIPQGKRRADYAWTVLARILSVGLDDGLIDTNPCERGGRVYKAERQDRVWSFEDEETFLANAPGHMKLPLRLALWTGQRQGDLLSLSWTQYDGRFLRFRQSKTKKRVVIPVGGPLRADLEEERGRQRSIEGATVKGHVLLNSRNLPWTNDGFRGSWRKACRRAAVTEDLTFHDLRGSAVTRLFHAGGEVAEIASFTGHSLKDAEAILDAHYFSRDLKFAESAAAKYEKWRAARDVQAQEAAEA